MEDPESQKYLNSLEKVEWVKPPSLIEDVAYLLHISVINLEGAMHGGKQEMEQVLDEEAQKIAQLYELHDAKVDIDVIKRELKDIFENPTKDPEQYTKEDFLPYSEQLIKKLGISFKK